MDETLRKRLVALTAAGRAQSLDFEGVAARVATDRFCSLGKPVPEDSARYAELMRGAIPQLDAATAQRIAAQLAPLSTAPADVLARLIAHSADAAASVLARAPALSRDLLLERARHGDVREAAAIAGRRDIDRAIVAALAQRLEPEALRALAANSAAVLDRGALITLTQRARLDLELGRLLLARDEGALDRTALFLSADAAMRRQILIEAVRTSLAGGGDLAGVFDRIRIEAIAAAETGERARFCTIVARALRVARTSIERLASDESGEPLGLIFAAMGLSATESEKPVLALRRDLAAALADPVSGLRFALQAPPRAASAILAALIPGRPQQARHEYALHQVEPGHQGARAPLAQAALKETLNRR